MTTGTATRQGDDLEQQDAPTFAHADDVARLCAAWAALAGVLDPEVPVVSIVELGIVRDVRVDDDELVVALTPTYSGCPATAVIEADARAALAAAEAGACRIEVRARAARGPPTGSRRRRASACARSASRRPATAGRIDVTGISPLRRRQRGHAVPALRLAQHRVAVAIRLDGLQGAVPLRRLPRAVRLLQAALTPRR